MHTTAHSAIIGPRHRPREGYPGLQPSGVRNGGRLSRDWASSGVALLSGSGYTGRLAAHAILQLKFSSSRLRSAWHALAELATLRYWGSVPALFRPIPAPRLRSLVPV